MQAATALSRAVPLPGPLPDLKLQSGHLDALRMLWVQVWLWSCSEIQADVDSLCLPLTLLYAWHACHRYIVSLQSSASDDLKPHTA